MWPTNFFFIDMIKILTKYLALPLILLLAAPVFTACSDREDFLYPGAENALRFSASIENQNETRASSPVNSDYRNINFYITTNYKPTSTSEYVELDQIGTYAVKNGYSGILEAPYKPGSQTKADTLNWQTADTDHIFYGWTFTQGTNASQPIAKVKDSEGNVIAYTPSRDPQTIYFNNEFFPDNWGDWQNGAVLEKFVGAENGPYSYETNGAYAPMNFYHLVSKMTVQVRAYDYAGYYTDLPYTMTIHGLPSQGTFYPYPEDAGGNPQRPYVEQVEKENDEVTFMMKGRNNSYTYPFYLCPDVDIKNLSYTIKLGDGSMQLNGQLIEKYFPGTYKGDFSKLNNFSNRTEQSTILHAGEFLHIVLWLMPDGGTGAGVAISPWDVMEGQEGTTYPRTGIFSSGEANELTGPNVDWGDIFGRYGDMNSSEPVINVYDNVEINSNILTVEDPYILDGLGHLFTLPEDTTEFTVQNVRNAYFTNGTDIIYIDADGNIYTVDPVSFQATPTGSSLNESEPTTINFTTS